ncbi:hypothetical protein K501DRAFT_320261 [Backusella circina FSU 941]|nr:hypothetical protein K501DRAFT_320261 [Backusella circina FSU 941]
MAPPSSASLQDRVLALVKTLQFSWFMGHVFTLIGTLIYVVSLVLFRSSTLFYKVAYVGAIVSYGVVIIKSHGTPKPNAEYARNLVMDENAQYLMLAVFWFFSSPIAVTLIPFAIFSIFHALGYVRTNIIPTVFPRPRTSGGAAASSNTWQVKTQQQIKSLTDKYYSIAMSFVAQSEVTIIAVRLVFGLLRLQFLPIFIFSQFLRFRYHLSTYTRQTFSDLRVKADALLLPPNADPRIPPIVTKAYTTIQGLIIRYGDAIISRQPAPAQ